MKQEKTKQLDQITSNKMEHHSFDSLKKMPFFHLLSRRFQLMILIMFGYSIMVFSRTNLSITMTCMVNSTSVALKNFGNKTIVDGLSNIPKKCLKIDINREDNDSSNLSKIVNDYGGTLNWDTHVQSTIISGTFWGALFTVLPSGFLVDHFSPKLIFLFAGLSYAVTSVVFPYLAQNFEYEYAFFDRIAMGLGEGFVLPAANTLISRWIPKVERGTAATMLTAGNQIAGALGNPISGILCSSTLGWQSVFYFCSFALTLWAILFALTTQSTPSKAKWMSEKEKLWLERELHRHGSSKKRASFSKIPFKEIFYSVPFWTVLLSQYTANVVIVIIQFYIPTFLKEALYLNVSDNGLISASPHVIQFIAKFAWSTFLENLQKKDKISPTNASKLSQLLSGLFVFFSFIFIPLTLDCTKPIYTIILFICTASGFGFCVCGYYTSLLNLAPQYTGVLTSISMVVAFLGRLSGPKLVSYFRETGAVEEWNSIFYLSSSFYLVSSVFYFVCGSAEAQKWGDVNDEQTIVEQGIILTTISDEDSDENGELQKLGIINKSTLDISSLNNI